MRKTETLNLRVTTEFKRKLTAEARREKRSVTNYLEVTLEEIWKEGDSGKTRPRKEKGIEGPKG